MTIHIEAEKMTRSGYSTESGSFASGGSLIKLSGTTGSASTLFSGITGLYTIAIGYFDENDGVAQLSLKIGGTLIDQWNLDQNLGSNTATAQTLVRRTIATPISIHQNSAIELQGILNGGEAARIDYIEFLPYPPPADTPPTATISTTNLTLSAGNSQYSLFSVTYTDNNQVDLASIDANDVIVTNANGVALPVVLVSVSGSGTSRKATYAVAPADLRWDSDDRGTYTVSVVNGQVRDTAGNGISGVPAKTFQVTVQTPVAGSPIRQEAETMGRSGYTLEAISGASGGLSTQTSTSGSLTTTFQGASGRYAIVVGYYDENDGTAQLSVQLNGSLLESWSLNQDYGSSSAKSNTFVRRTIANGISIAQGSQLTIQGVANRGENARIDYLEFFPIADPPLPPVPTLINGTNGADVLTANAIATLQGLDGDDSLNGSPGDDFLNGGDGADRLWGGKGQNRLDGGTGSDTADYSQASQGVTVNLDRGIGLAPLFGTSAVKVMPMGDSITAGEHRLNPVPGAYRTQLWQNFAADGLAIDFVGSLSNGGANLPDHNHQGQRGWTISQMTNLVNTGLLTTYQPDVILLMIGTNDAGSRTGSQMIASLSTLIDRIYSYLPTVQVVVSSIAPILDFTRNQRASDFNARLPGLVSQKVAQGRKVTFTDAGGSLDLTDLTIDGLHPSAAGYDKMGNAWYGGLVDRDLLSNIENIQGSAFQDILIGNGGANVIEGGNGNDWLTGGEGADIFVYRNPAAGQDIITDWSSTDLIQISASGFGNGLVNGTPLTNGIPSATGVFIQGTTAIDTSPSFLYSNSVLSFDPDGMGSQSALTIATLQNNPTLTAGQIAIGV